MWINGTLFESRNHSSKSRRSRRTSLFLQWTATNTHFHTYIQPKQNSKTNRFGCSASKTINLNTSKLLANVALRDREIDQLHNFHSTEMGGLRVRAAASNWVGSVGGKNPWGLPTKLALTEQQLALLSGDTRTRILQNGGACSVVSILHLLSGTAFFSSLSFSLISLSCSCDVWEDGKKEGDFLVNAAWDSLKHLLHHISMLSG